MKDTNDTFVCSNCEDEFHVDECHHVCDSELCDTCFDDMTITCSHCGNAVWNDDIEGSDRTPLCTNCYEHYYTTCENCGRVIHEDRACYDDDYPYCSRCYDERCDNEHIHEYDYKPEPIFYGDDSRYFGVEVEIDGAGEYSDNADTIEHSANRHNQHVYIKHDGSLDRGLEIVSHPMSLDYHINQMNWLDVFETAINLGYRSHKTNTCGLHVHVNRNTFGDTEDEQSECISRVLFFVERFWQELLCFSRRTETQVSRWAARYGMKDNPKAVLDNAKKSYSGRYACVNLTNYQTIEFRIFRGTLKYNTFLATLQLVNEICNVAACMSDEQVTSMSWCDFVSCVTSPELITYLKERRLYVNEPIENVEEDL